MRGLREGFVVDVESTTKEAMGIHVMLAVGMEKYEPLARKNPRATLMIGTQEPTNPGRNVTHIPTHQETLDALHQHPDRFFELYLSSLVQLWNEFLCDVYQLAVRASLKSPGRGVATALVP